MDGAAEPFLVFQMRSQSQTLREHSGLSTVSVGARELAWHGSSISIEPVWM